MNCDLHALDTSHTWVTRVNLKDEPRAKQTKKSQKRAQNEAPANLL